MIKDREDKIKNLNENLNDDELLNFLNLQKLIEKLD
jgi:hypothetical protein